MPPAENVHWLFATAVLALGLCLLGEGFVGVAVLLVVAVLATTSLPGA